MSSLYKNIDIYMHLLTCMEAHTSQYVLMRELIIKVLIEIKLCLNKKEQ